MAIDSAKEYYVQSQWLQLSLDFAGMVNPYAIWGLPKIAGVVIADNSHNLTHETNS